MKKIKKYEVLYNKNCDRCSSKECEVRERSVIPDKGQYFTEWDYCKKCKNVQFKEKNRRFT